jgi:hypothetical protein
MSLLKEDLFNNIYSKSQSLREATADELESLIQTVNDALHTWAEDKQIYKSEEEHHNDAQFELTCDKKGDGTYISITIPKTVGYFPLNRNLLDFIDLIDSDEVLQNLINNAEQSWTLFTGQSGNIIQNNWKSKDCIEIALCGIPGIWSDPESNENQKAFLERVLDIIEWSKK